MAGSLRPAPTSGAETVDAAFATFAARDVIDLVAAYPLAWCIAADGEAAMLPLLIERSNDDVLELIGHVGKRTPLAAGMMATPAATILFQGPQAYVSPEWVRDRNWAPTWNFAFLHAHVLVTFTPDETEAAVQRLIDHMEGGNASWSMDELGARRAGMMDAIIGFRARIISVRGRFKLGQDERPEIRSDILAALGDCDLAAWMRRFNPAL